MNLHNRDPAAMEQGRSPQATSQAGMNGCPPDGRGRKVDTEELYYEPVPPKKTVTLSIRYRVRGRGRPLPYPLDDADDE